MAAIDGLLNLVLAQGADTLTLTAGAVPELTKAGERVPLSMPPLLPELVQRFIGEIRDAGDGLRYEFESKQGPASFDVVIEEPNRIELQRCSGGADEEPAPPLPPPGGAPPPGSPTLQAPLEGSVATSSSTPTPTSASISSPAPSSRALVSPSIDPMIARLVEEAIAADATDLFVSSSADARVRVGMVLSEIPASRVSEHGLLALAGLDAERRARLESHGSIDLALYVGETRVRANVFRHRSGLSAALRPLRRIRSLAELGLPRDLESLADLSDGLVLLVGPTGSGKSTTLAALVDHLNRTQARHVVTIEDPIEYEHPSQSCLVHQREVGRDVESFAAGLRAALRESPDVILVGEMRDAETFAAALTAAETGHLVFSTLHSGSAPMAIDRIIDSFPPHQQQQVRGQLAGALRSIVTQVLLPTLEPGGVVAATERMIVTHAIAHAIRDARGHQISDRIQTGRAEGMVSLEASLADLVRRGRISAATASAAARNPDVLRGLLQA